MSMGRKSRACLYLSKVKNQHGHGVCWISTRRKNGFILLIEVEIRPANKKPFLK